MKETLMLKAAAAWSPGHITAFFEIADADPDPLRRGSRGAGLSLAAGVTTRVRFEPRFPAAVTISLNGIAKNDAPVSRRVIELFFDRLGMKPAGRLAVAHQIAVPEGAGFGSSGAGALSLALALNAAWGGPLEEIEAAQLAHRAEIDRRTGLGTVLACTVGGLEIRTRAGAPGVGEVRSIALPPELSIFCLVFGPLPTAVVLSDPDRRRRINAAYRSLSQRLEPEPDARSFMEAARTFSASVGLATPRLAGYLAELEALGFAAGQTMFGEAVFLLIDKSKRSQLDAVASRAAAAGARVFESGIAKEGGTVIHDA